MAGLHDLLRASAEQAPAQPVFVRKDATCAYERLEQASGRFAAGLRSLGVKKGDRVALVLDGDVDFLIAYYGIAKAGAVVVPLCTDTRTGPLVHALAHSGATAVILDAENAKYVSGADPSAQSATVTQERENSSLSTLRWLIYRGKLPAGGPFEHVAFDSLLTSNEMLHDSGTSPDDLLSITYTSGTTGRPKGVMLTHRNLTANVLSIVEYLRLTPDDRVAMVLPFYYVYGNSVLHTHVAAGATIVHAGSMTFPAEVLKTIETARCTGLSGVPATFARLLNLASLGTFDLSSLRYLTQAGAAMQPTLTARLREVFRSARIFVMYGQTEASARLAYVPPEDLDRKLGSAGKAIPGVELLVVDAEGQELPRGVVGEIVARGDNVMQGYWSDSEATRLALRRGRLHTGDLAKMDEEGFLYIVGRESELIKSGAHRISPREIETAIESVVGVRECAVAGVPSELMGQAIAAFIVAAEGQSLDRQAILRACLSELPRFKLPEHVFFLPELPRTATGKVRRAELVEWFLREHGRTPSKS